MVRRQRERSYLSGREQRESSAARAGHSSSAIAATGKVQRRLPFDHCALSLTSFSTPVCNKDGIVFENSAIAPFLIRHKIDPVTGDPMTTRDLITLNMDQDEEGRWQCPVLTKPLQSHIKIVAILQPSGKEANVYSFEAYHELNVKAKNYEDLTTGNKFDKKKDVLVLNDPGDDNLNKKRDINTFYHIRHARELEIDSNKRDGNGGQVKHSVTATRIMEQLQKNKEKNQKDLEAKQTKRRSSSDEALPARTKRPKILASDVTGVVYSSGKAASSLTSTAQAVSYQGEDREATLEEVLQSQFAVMRKRKRKGYVRLHTNLGSLTFELHCDIVPRTCTNFLGLCNLGSYNQCNFHRLIPNFMIQGGKNDKADDDESLWGEAFDDEFDDRLKHNGKGILSMANAGPRTNKRQFFITFAACSHLDRKHSVFGTIIDGIEVLSKMEQTPTDKKKRPTETIVILSTEVLEDPAKEAENLEQERLDKLREARLSKKSKSGGKSLSNTSAHLFSTVKADEKQDTVIGKYIKAKREGLPKNDSAKSNKKDDTESFEIRSLSAKSLKPPPKTSKPAVFGDFSSW